jgi:hypothetical protein
MLRDVNLTLDEVDLIVDVTNYAMAQLGRPRLSSVLPEDGQPPSVVEMRNLNSAAGMTFWPFPIRRSISRDDLVFLTPYIEDWIAGKVAPQNLPAEYEDWRPQALREFKERMLREGLWPQPSTT